MFILKSKIYRGGLFLSAFVAFLLPLYALAGYIYSAISKLHSPFMHYLVLPISILVPSFIGYLVIRLTISFSAFGLNNFTKKVFHIDWLKTIKKALTGIQDIIPALILSFLITISMYLFAKLIGWVNPEKYQYIICDISQKYINSFFSSLQEEVLFRLFLLTGLAYCLGYIIKKDLSVVFSLVLVSMLFGYFHFKLDQLNNYSWAHYILYVSAGLVLGYSFVITKSLWFSLGFHFGSDFFIGLLPILTRSSILDSSDWYYLLGVIVLCIFVIPYYALLKNIYKTRKHWLW